MNEHDETGGSMTRAEDGGVFQAGTGRDQSLVEKIRDVLAATEVMAQLQERILNTVIKLTTPDHWTDQGGKPYLTEPGCNAAASHLPCKSWIVSEPRKSWGEDDRGPYYIYVCQAAAAWKTGLGEVSALGTGSSRDKFFGMKSGEPVPVSEIDETSVLKKCGTNGRGNAYRRLFGVQSLSWEKLEECGIRREAVVAVRYDSKRKTDENPEQSAVDRDEIWRLLLEMNNGDPRAAADGLEKMTAWEKDGVAHKGKRDVKWLTEKQVSWKLSEVKTRYAGLKAKTSPASEGDVK